jgi:hypothetical protein
VVTNGTFSRHCSPSPVSRALGSWLSELQMSRLQAKISCSRFSTKSRSAVVTELLLQYPQLMSFESALLSVWQQPLIDKKKSVGP